MKIVRTRRGARIIQDDVVLSEILARPGPTHTLFDVLAAGVVAASPGPRFAMLGFAGGGVVAPLRAMGFESDIDAVDLSREGEPLFRELSSEWAGTVRLAQQDASAWLRRPRTPYDTIMEDLSMPSPAGVVKPYASFDDIPEAIRKRLGPKGVCVTNLLPLPGTSWEALQARVMRPYRCAALVHVTDYENRVVIAGDALADTPTLSRRVREALARIGSHQTVSLRTLIRSSA